MTYGPSASTSGTAEAKKQPNPDLIVVVLAVAGITAALMQTLVLPILGELPQLLGTTTSNASWVITATLLAAAVATPISGRLGDLYGKRQVMIACAILLVAGSLVAALATSVLPMIIGRALQGMAMGLIPLGISAMRDLLPEEKLGGAIALMSASMGVGAAAGLPVAAAIAEYSHWRVLFWVSTVLAVLLLLMFVTLIPATPVSGTGRFDPIGAIGLGAALVCLLLGLSKGAEWGWGSSLTIGLLIGSVVLFLAWGWFELRISDPLVNLRSTARPVVLLTNAASVVIGFAMYAGMLIMPQLLQIPAGTGYGLGYSMLAMGLWLLPGGLVMMYVSTRGAKISGHRGPKFTLVLGAAVIATGYLIAVVFMSNVWGIVIAHCVINAGVGLAYGAMPALIMSAVPVSETAAANSFNTLMRSIGTSISAAAVGVVLGQMTMSYGDAVLPSESGFRVGLAIGAVMAIIAALVATTIPRRGTSYTEDEDVDDSASKATA